MKLSLGPVDIVTTVPEHLPGFWEILKDYPGFWADRSTVKSREEFISWYGDVAKDSLTGIDNGVIVGGGYLDTIYPGFYATINIFKQRGYLNPGMVSKICRQALPCFFEKYQLEKIVGITRVDHEACIRLLKRVGLKVTGTMRHHRKVDGVWTDYVWSEILREELAL